MEGGNIFISQATYFSPDNVSMLDLWLDHDPPQPIEAADEVAHRVGEKVVAVGDPGLKVEQCRSYLLT